MISAICVFNSEQILKDCLLQSLLEQKTAFETIIIDNTQNRFKSAAEALNWGAKQAVGDYLMFVHQDVDLCSNSFFDGLEALLDSLPKLGVAGVAGVSEHGGPFLQWVRNTVQGMPQARHRNAITHGLQRERCGTPIREPEPVQTLDECLIIIPKVMFEKTQFDEVTCDDWHLYAADYCLSVGARGFIVYAIPKRIHHRSKGCREISVLAGTASLTILPEEYYRTLQRVLKKHKNSYKLIHVSFGSWNTVCPLKLQRVKPDVLFVLFVILNVILRLIVLTCYRSSVSR
jgi:hypothetical protein